MISTALPSRSTPGSSSSCGLGRRLAGGYRATFAAVLNSAALDTLSLINTAVFAVAVPAHPVPSFVERPRLRSCPRVLTRPRSSVHVTA
eukprot:1111950-Pleurochrysis_carterae.AAC.1